MKISEAAKELGIETEDYVYRLIRTGALKAEKVGSRWNVDPDSVALRKARVMHKRNSRSNVAAERERKKAEATAGFEVLP